MWGQCGSGRGPSAGQGALLQQTTGHLQAKHRETAASAGLEFRVGLGALAARGLVEGDAGFGRSAGAGFACAVEGAHQGGVDGELRTMPQG